MASTSTPSRKRAHEPGRDLNSSSGDESESEMGGQLTPPPTKKVFKRRRIDSANEADAESELSMPEAATPSKRLPTNSQQNQGRPEHKLPSPIAPPTRRDVVRAAAASQMVELVDLDDTPPASPNFLRTASEASSSGTTAASTANKPGSKSPALAVKRSPGPTTVAHPEAIAPTATASGTAGKTAQSLHDIPKLADRFVPKILTAEGVDETNPQKFCTKPAYWKAWAPQLYRDFAEELHIQFDPIPFARKMNLPVEEVRHVFSALVTNPLYDLKVQAKRGEEGMKKILGAYQKFTKTRAWSEGVDGAQTVFGDFDGLEGGFFRIVAVDGSEVVRRASELSENDAAYLFKVRKDLGKEDKQAWSDLMSAEDKVVLNALLTAGRERDEEKGKAK